jgi:hypothetical protein
MLAGRTPTKVEKKWMNDICEYVGCIVCRLYQHPYTPCEVHHIGGKTKPNAHLNSIPLCPYHHRIPSNTGEWVSRADGKKAFEEAYGEEEWLLEATKQLLEKEKEMRSV